MYSIRGILAQQGNKKRWGGGVKLDKAGRTAEVESLKGSEEKLEHFPSVSPLLQLQPPLCETDQGICSGAAQNCTCAPPRVCNTDSNTCVFPKVTNSPFIMPVGICSVLFLLRAPKPATCVCGHICKTPLHMPFGFVLSVSCECNRGRNLQRARQELHL